MEYCEFKNEIIKKIQKLTDDGVHVSESEARKNNGMVLEALLFRDDRSNVSPQIYMRPWYERMQRLGLGLDETAEGIYRMYLEHRKNGDMDTKFFVDYGQARHRVIYSLVNYEMNKDMLDQVPHRRFLDLAVTYSVAVCLSEGMGIATIRIENQHMEMWGTDVDELEACAKENTPRLLGWDLREMYSLICDLLGSSDTSIYGEGNPTNHMYVLTNHKKFGGASCILYPGLLEKIAGDLGSNLCILPCSTNEVIIIPHNEDTDMHYLNDMVREINTKELERMEILSDHAYVYDRKEARLSAA